MIILNDYDARKWIENQLEFLKPLVLFAGTLYFPPLLVKLGSDGYVLQLADFVPSQAVVVAVIFYLTNALWDFVRKWASTKN